MNRLLSITRIIASLLLAVTAHRSPAEDEASPPTEIMHLGRSYIQTLRREDSSVETIEYTPKGETPGEWSQLLTVQRLRLPREARPSDLTRHLAERVSALPHSRFSLEREGTTASVFSATLSPSDGAPEHRVIGIICLDTSRPTNLEVLQFALVPGRVEAAEAELLLDSWRRKFLLQAEASERPDSAR